MPNAVAPARKSRRDRRPLVKADVKFAQEIIMFPSRLMEFLFPPGDQKSGGILES
jgi:hypothetical protein